MNMKKEERLEYIGVCCQNKFYVFLFMMNSLHKFFVLPIMRVTLVLAMRKIYLSIAFLLIFLISTRAQKITLGEMLNVSTYSAEMEAIGLMQDELLCYIRTKDTAFLHWYDTSTMSITHSLALDINDKNYASSTFFISNDAIYYFEQIKNKKELKLYCHKIKDYQVQENMLLDSMLLDGLFDASLFLLNTNTAHDQFMYCINKRFYGESKNEIKAKVINTQFNIINQLNTTVPAAQNFEIITASNGPNGNMVLVFGEKRFGLKQYSQIALLHKSPQNPEAKVTNIANKDFYLGGFKEQWGEHEIRFGVLYYKNRNNDLGAIGILNFDILTDSISSASTIPIRTASKNDRDKYNNILLKEMHWLADGGFEMVCEKSFSEMRSSRNVNFDFSMMPSANISTKTYYDLDIYIFNVNKDDALLWTQNVLKHQESQNDISLFSSFGSLEHQLGNVYLFNENLSKGNRIIASYISYKGEQQLKQISFSGRKNEELILRGAKQISNKDLICPSISNNGLSFVKISF